MLLVVVAAAAAAAEPAAPHPRGWAMAATPMRTPFAAAVRPTQAPAYPRPQLRRGPSSWQHLNGLFALDIQFGERWPPAPCPCPCPLLRVA